MKERMISAMKSIGKTRVAILALFVSVFVSCSAFAEGVVITTGAGYKPMIEELASAFRKSGGKIQEMYGGHIGQMLAQIRQGSDVNVVISDRNSLDAAAQGLKFDVYQALGSTPLVLAWRKGIELKEPRDLEKPFVKSVCHPDTKAAIYGRAAAKFLETSGIGKKIGGKVSAVSTVPQVFAYLVSGEMDAGFLNRVMTLRGGDKLGGWIEIHKGYAPLNMVAAVVGGKSDDPAIPLFLLFLKSAEGKSILKKHGVW